MTHYLSIFYFKGNALINCYTNCYMFTITSIALTLTIFHDLGFAFVKSSPPLLADLARI